MRILLMQTLASSLGYHDALIHFRWPPRSDIDGPERIHSLLLSSRLHPLRPVPLSCPDLLPLTLALFAPTP